jgi:hypothetical protein
MLHACFYTICLMFHYTSWHFYAFSGTNLLTSRHSASFLFSAVFVFQKSYTGNISELDETKASHPDISWSFQRTEEEMEWGHEVASHQGGAAQPLAAPLCVRPPCSTSDDAPSPIKTPLRENPEYPINFPETHRDPPPSSTRDWEGPEALHGTLPERGITTGGLLHRHACQRSDE